mmetsp:Transcript_5616/g.12239  ORF Transcript_5616/g.12239 Transcript_5616/m.12239 type:complete len:700 (+) Transcript_5616:209-2308(+)|eukprot:CAMPEP_0183707136 /NCGR_PEP_ID=MMETSP0737-20130205/3775_1 /TAXON_ID=385413 /ORGANISM="Thalassiosira miniscula, Strain CCMP1093" /LENGTH=699 /DNA_ID=CAMNT_0025934717 /DNA_START=200 /DNA_END=2299 /DNA_ORIENTATION=+
MKSLLLLLTTAAATTGLLGLLLLLPVVVVHGQTYVCEIPTAGCTNGMFNQAMCECECIEPFCHDGNGDCTNPSNNCGGNRWKSCTRGVNCPWWVNALKAESCTTGPDVPPGIWKIYNTREACCNTNFAYSNVCDAVAENENVPTKHPTIVAPEDDIYEVIPIKFDVFGLPDDVSMRELKNEMKTVLKRILLRLAKSISGLKVSEIEEKIVANRRELQFQRKNSNSNNRRGLRSLARDVSIFFNVFVIRDDNKKFGPLIIQEIGDSYNELISEIQTFTDVTYFGGDIDLNMCTSHNGKFELCAKEIERPSPPTPTSQSQPSQPFPPPAPSVIIQSTPSGGSSGGDGGGLPGWAIALIVIIVLIILCCIGYFIWASCFRDQDHETKQLHNNIYMDGGRGGERSMYGDSRSRRSRRDDKDLYLTNGRSEAASEYTSRRSRGGGGRSRRSRRDRDRGEDDDDDVQIVLAEPQDPQFDDDVFTINTYGTSKNRNRPGRDPTSYVPGQEDRPDPDSGGGGGGGDLLMIKDGASSRRYYEDPPLKPKRDPTMYGGGGGGGGNYDDYATEDPPLKPKRDPTMYVDGRQDASVYGGSAADYSARSSGNPRDPTMYMEGGASVEGYSVDPYGMGGVIDDDEEEYDEYGFKSAELEAKYMTSETNAEYAGIARDPSYYAQDEDTYRTQDASVAKSKKSSKSKKSKKSSRR